ncbi:MAG: hypothetical protein ACRDL6_03955 [Solirubrobacterales bacterium]
MPRHGGGIGVGRRRLRRGIAPVAAGALLAALVFADTAATQLTGANCTRGEKQTIETGIVKAIGCWTEATNSAGQQVHTARFEDQVDGGIDLNGFVVTGPAGGALQINESTREVTSVVASSGAAAPNAQLQSRNWPSTGQLNNLGLPFTLDFIAPEKSGLLLETLHLGSNSVAGALAGLSPVGTIETPVRLEEEGTGSMDLTVALAGIFTLKGKPQSVTIDLPTSSGEGTKLDGFDLELEEIDAVKFLTINELSAKYSASTKVIAGSANLTLPAMSKTKGFGAAFQLDNGVLSKLSFSVHGTKIPIGAAGFLTDIAGGFSFQPVQALDFDKWCKSQGFEKAVIVGADHGTGAAYRWYCQKGGKNTGLSANAACQHQTGNQASVARSIDTTSAYSWQCVGGISSGATSFDLSANASLGADFGPVVPSPFGTIEPIRVDSSLGIGYGAGGLLIQIHGGLALFRLPVGDAYLIINTHSGVAFGVGLGIGFPSFRNNENDPFYIGARVDGWVGGGHFQLDGKGRIAVFNLKLLDGEILVNDRAVAACWTVIGVPGGAVYQYGGVVKTFGIGCGLGDYKEQFQGGGSAAAAAGRTRKFDLSGEQKVLTVKGAGAPPKFTLRSRDGRRFRTPTDSPSELNDDHAFIINEFTDTTHVVIPDPKGKWKVVRDNDSVPITSLKAAREVPKERVKAHVEGKGHTRTLVWDSLNRPNTRLVFTELLPGGTEVPILHTGRASGRKRFKVVRGSQYGKRRLHVTIIHGHGSRQQGVHDHYTVNPPGKMAAPRRVSAWRHDHGVYVTWSGVEGAHGYLVEVSTAAAGDRRASNYVRKVSADTRRVAIPHHPDGERGVAKVFALNSDDKLGRKARQGFAPSPSARGLREAARRSAKSAVVRRGGVAVRMQCPEHGHCRVEAELRRRGRRVSSTSFQQAPDTFHLLRLKAKGGTDDLRLVVKLSRTGEQAKAKATPKR